MSSQDGTWVGHANVRGHATFRDWSSHHAWAKFKVTLDGDGQPKSIVAVKVYTQSSASSGGASRPRFRANEWARMKDHALEVSLRKSQGNVVAAAQHDEVVVQEVPQEKRHRIDLCEKCRELGFSCTGNIQDVNGTWYHCPLRVLRDRRTRLDSCPPRQLYHQTSQVAATAIIETQTMLRGSAGLCGGGIYFAETPEETHGKALRHGVILKVEVKLGRAKTVGADGDTTITFGSLLTHGFDSVLCLRPGGKEFIVYNSDQVVSVSRYR